MDERGAVPAKVSKPVSENEIFADEVPIVDPATGTDNEDDAADRAGRAEPASEPASEPEPAPAPDPHQTPDGAVTDDQGDEAQAEQPAPSEHTEPTGDEQYDKALEQMEAQKAAAKQAVAERQAVETSKKVAETRSTAPAANPDKPKGRMRKALEKRLFGLLGEVGLADDENRDGRIAVYRSILERDDVGSTDDLDNPAISKVADQLYAWSELGELGEKVEGILSDAARAEVEAAGQPPAEPHQEGNE
jgi:hypothetical protein